MNVNAYAAQKAGSELSRFSYDLADPSANEVIVKVSHCGICHSDVHLIDDDWGYNLFPLVAGHEVVGEVVSCGSAVTHLKPGARVGIGWQAGSCMHCEWCESAQENLCSQSASTCVGNHGGFGDHLSVDSRFAFELPEGLSSVDAAPLLCGGITVYSPLRRYGVRHWHKVGVVGIGGLGHMALQFAKAMGCEVTAFSSSPEKEAEAKSLGATHFVNSRDADALKAQRDKLDFILVTATADLDWKPYVKALRTNGKLCFVTGEATSVDVPVSMLLGRQKTVTASIIGGRAMMSEMLDFAARKGIGAMTEVMPVKEINAALQKVRDNQARYRMVLEW